MNKIYVVGIGFKPLDKKARAAILNSRIILTSSNRLFEIFKEYEEFEKVKDRVKVINDVDETINFLKSKIQNPKSKIIVLLASGDSLFHGIGRRVISEIGRDAVEIFPDLSSIQVAFSRIKEPWDDAFLVSLHGGKRKKLEYAITDLPFLLKTHKKLAILTDKTKTPVEIAKVLASSLIPCQMFVCERLGYADEKITEGTPEEIATLTRQASTKQASHFSNPNVVIIKYAKRIASLTNTGKLYVIGIGPGDPELLTLKAVRILRDVPCICVPKGKEEGSSLALSIVEKTLNLEGKEIFSAYFPMKKTKASKYQSEFDTEWQKTISAILGKINKGMDVAFITLGDPGIYSTFFYLYDRLLELNPNLDIKIIPGVSSINAAASMAKIPLGLADERIVILPANYVIHLKETLQQFDTVILMKVSMVFGDILKTLTDMGILNRAIYISRAGMEDEKIFKDIKDVKAKDLNYFSMVIVKR